MIIYSADWAISSTTIAVLLAIVCVIILAACSFMLLKMYHNGMNGDSSIIIAGLAINLSYCFCSENTEKEIEMKQNEVYGISSRPL